MTTPSIKKKGGYKYGSMKVFRFLRLELGACGMHTVMGCDRQDAA